MNEKTLCNCKKEDLEKNKKELPENILAFIENCKTKPHSESYIIDVLHMIQDHFGYLAKEKIEAVAQLMQIPAAKISGLASFYHLFRLKKRGKYIISICLGTACHVKGADKIAKKLKEELGIEFGETTNDGLFTLEEARCLGMCALAPVLKIEDEIYAEVTVDKISAILEKYLKK